MKIGVITSAYPEYEDDPHGIFVHRLMMEIVKHGHEVSVLAPYAGDKTKYNLEGVDVERFNYFYPRRFQRLAGRSGMIDNVKDGVLVKLQVLTFLFFNVVHSLTKFRDMDIVHVQWPIPNGLGALFLKKLYGIPYINTIHGEEVYLSKRYHMVFAFKWIVNNAKKTITNSSATRDSCLKAGLDGDKIQVIPFGVDTSFFKPLKLPKNENEFQILSVGYLIERKGYKYLIKAMKDVLNENINVRLKIVGSGPLEYNLQNIIRELKLENEVKIMKNVSDQELLHLYNSSDLFVLPSIIDSQGNTEGLGVVLLEAMACGLPVIGSDVGGIPDIIIQGKSGILVKEKDVSDLSDNIIKMLKDDILRNRLAEFSIKMVDEKFSWKIVSGNYITVYKSLQKK